LAVRNTNNEDKIFVYQAQEKKFRLNEKNKIDFPFLFELKIILGPEDTFGGIKGGKQAYLILDKPHRMAYDANKG